MINNTYLNDEALEQIKTVLNKEGVITLYGFLANDYYSKLLTKLKQFKFQNNYDPPRFSYKSFKLEDNKLKPSLSLFIAKILNLNLQIDSDIIFCFEHRDYTLMNDSSSEIDGIKIILELTPNWDESSGGYTSFIKNKEEVFRLYPIKNSLTIIKTKNEFKSFVKYVNHFSGKNKRYFLEFIIFD